MSKMIDLLENSTLHVTYGRYECVLWLV